MGGFCLFVSLLMGIFLLRIFAFLEGRWDEGWGWGWDGGVCLFVCLELECVDLSAARVSGTYLVWFELSIEGS